MHDVHVSRRYGDFKRLADEVSKVSVFVLPFEISHGLAYTCLTPFPS